MGMPTPSMPQNPTNQPMQQHQMDGKGGGKGMSGSGMATPPISQGNTPTPMDQGYRSTLQQPQASSGKGGSSSPDQMEQIIPNNTTMSATSGQPQNGQPNAYANTTGSWDNQSNQQPQAQMGGKGKGA